MSEQEAMARLRALVGRCPTQGAAARELGVSAAYLSDILHGRRGFSDRILAELGLAREVVIVGAMRAMPKRKP